MVGPVLSFVTHLEQCLELAKAENASKGAILSALLDAQSPGGADARPGAEHSAAAGRAQPGDHADLREALELTDAQLEDVRMRLGRVLQASAEVEHDLSETRLKLARGRNRERHGEPSARELAAALRSAEELHARAHAARSTAEAEWEQTGARPSTAVHTASNAHARRAAALDGVGASLRASALEAESLAEAVRRGLDALGGGGGAGAARNTPAGSPARLRSSQGVDDGRLSPAVHEATRARLAVESSQRAFAAAAAWHAAVAHELAVLERVDAEQRGLVLTLRTECDAACKASASEAGAHAATARWLERADVAAATGDALSSHGPSLGAAHALARQRPDRKRALAQLRERGGALQSRLASAERASNDAEADFSRALSACADQLDAAHAASARSLAAAELGAEAAAARCQLEAELTDGLNGLLDHRSASTRSAGQHAPAAGTAPALQAALDWSRRSARLCHQLGRAHASIAESLGSES